MKSDIHVLLNRQVTEFGPDRLLREMGYLKSSMPKARQRLKATLSGPFLGLDQSHYDLRYSNRGFLEALFNALALTPEEATSIIEALEPELHQRRYGFRPWLFIETDFRRSTQPVLALAAMESSRRIRLPTRIGTSSREATIQLAADKTRAHYRQSRGRLPLWGVIKEYKLIIQDDEQVVLNPAGEPLRTERLNLSSVAALTLS